MRILAIIDNEILRGFYISQVKELFNEKGIVVEFPKNIATARNKLFITEDLDFGAVVIAGFGDKDRHQILRFVEDVKASKRRGFAGLVCISSDDPELYGRKETMDCCFFRLNEEMLKKVVSVVAANERTPILSIE